MKITIDEDVLQREGFTFPELLLLMFLKTNASVDETLRFLKEKNAVTTNILGEIVIFQGTDEKVQKILLDSESTKPRDDKITNLAIEMMKLYPQSKMPGTPYYYKCNKREVSLKLKKFFKIYGEYPDEDILNATRKYVESFNGDYHYMKLLKYFIMKEGRKSDEFGNGYIEETSMLATILENPNEENFNWMESVR